MSLRCAKSYKLPVQANLGCQQKPTQHVCCEKNQTRRTRTIRLNRDIRKSLPACYSSDRQPQQRYHMRKPRPVGRGFIRSPNWIRTSNPSITGYTMKASFQLFSPLWPSVSTYVMRTMLEESKVIATDKSKPENPFVCLVFLDTSSTRPTRSVPFQPDQRGAQPGADRSIPRHPRMWDSRIFPGLLRDPGDFIFLRRWDSLAPFSLLPCPCRFERFRAIKVIHTSDDTPCTNRKTLPGCKSMLI